MKAGQNVCFQQNQSQKKKKLYKNYISKRRSSRNCGLFFFFRYTTTRISLVKQSQINKTSVLCDKNNITILQKSLLKKYFGDNKKDMLTKFLSTNRICLIIFFLVLIFNVKVGSKMNQSNSLCPTHLNFCKYQTIVCGL